jgi:hypothetical protein
VTGGTGSFGNAGGDGMLVEFGNGKGKLTLHLLSLIAGAGEAEPPGVVIDRLPGCFLTSA